MFWHAFSSKTLPALKPPRRNALPLLAVSLITGAVFGWLDWSYSPAPRNLPGLPAHEHPPMDDKGIQVNLSPEQRQFLEVLGPVQLAVDPDWMPFEFVTEAGEFVGIAPDLLDLMARRLGIQFEVIPTVNWEETLQIGRAGEAHALPFLNQTPERDTWLLFTDPYFIDPNVFVSREEHDFISNPHALQNTRIVLPHGTSIEERIRRDFPNLDVVTVESEADTFRYVEKRKADLTLRSLTMAAWVIKQEGWFNLKIAGEIPEYANHLRIGVRPDLSMLRDILNLGIATLTPAEVQEAVNRYIAIQVVEPTNLQPLFRTASLFSLALALSLVWSHRLQRLSLKLYESERSKSILLANLPGIAYRCKNDPDWTMIYISEGCQELTGYTSMDLLNNRTLSFQSLILPEYREQIWQAWQKAIREECALRLEYKIRTRDGDEKWIYEQGMPVSAEKGTVEYLEGLMIDVTDRKHMEQRIQLAQAEAEQAAGVKSRFLAMMSHEIRTPLNGILGLSEQLAARELPPEWKQEVNMIQNSGKHLLDLINDILEFSRLEAGKVVFEPESFCLRSFFESVVDAFRYRADEKNLHLSLLLDPSLPETGVADTGRLRQIMTNLIGNALKFTDRGGVRVKVRMKGVNRLVLSVEDTGIGIHPEQQAKLFDEFVQGNSAMHRKYGGSGLGLAICRQLAEGMGGEITLKSRPGKGSTFIVAIPMPAAPDLAVSSRDTSGGTRPRLSGRVLLVEDHPINARVATAILEDLGLEVTPAGDGLKALELLPVLQPDVVLMDLELPGIDGFETVRLMREREQARGGISSQVPVVALTAHLISEIEDRCGAVGITGILSKPMNPAEVYRVLSGVLQA